MESAPAATAPQVCLTCKLRKKGCDKLLPCCTYCQKRGLLCRYLPVTATPPSPAATESAIRETSSTATWYPSPPRSRIFRPDLQYSPQEICEQVCQAIGEIGQHADVLAHGYFRGLHLWIPVLSRDSFHRSLVRFPDSGDADFAILLLAVCLVAYLPTGGHHMHLDELYLTAKAIVARLQLYPAASLDSIRALSLLAMFEYSTQRCNEALTTLTTAIRMSYSIHLREQGQGYQPPQSTPEQGMGFYRLEANNLWWTLVICERLLVLETSNPWQPLLTPLPSEQYPLPHNLATPLRLGNRPSITSFASVDGFGRAAQAAILLDRVMSLVTKFDSDAPSLNQIISTDLMCIDADIQSFLSLVLEQCRGAWGQFCCSVATALKAMFLLHGEGLEKLPQYISESQSRASRAALDTAAQIMTDISRSHVTKEEHISVMSTLPPTCIYNIRSSILWLHEGSEQSSMASEDIVILRSFLEAFERRWPARQKD